MSIVAQFNWKGFDLTQTSVLILTEKKLYFAFSAWKKKAKKLDPSMDESGILDVLGRKKVKSTPLVEIEKIRYVENDTKFVITHKDGKIVVAFRDGHARQAGAAFGELVAALPGLELADQADAKRGENLDGPYAMIFVIVLFAGLAAYGLSSPKLADEHPVFWLMQKIGGWPIGLAIAGALAGCGVWIKRRLDNPIQALVYSRSPLKGL